jgi:hypothetical protein
MRPSTREYCNRKVMFIGGSVKAKSFSDFPPPRDFRNAGLYELLRARDAWHLPLSSMYGVIGTAIGLYRFREEDNAELLARSEGAKPRRFSTSRINGDSWPCVLVFVDAWRNQSEFYSGSIGTSRDPAHIVPQFLYTRDGLVVPTCVVEVDLAEEEGNRGRANPYFYPSSALGGGIPLFRDDQGVVKAGLAACLVRDNARSYALTAAHVAGEPGTALRCPSGAAEIVVGRSSVRRILELPAAELFPEWPELESRQTIDAALVEIDDLDAWTSQVYRIGDIGRAPDFNAMTLTLELLSQPLVMCGADANLVRGEILGLFPRYKTAGGIDYCADLLIGPSSKGESGGAEPRDGCSGGLWLFERELKGGKKEYLPVGLNWGLMDLRDGSGPIRLSLATFVSSALSALGVEIETGRNTGYGPVWGMKVHPVFADIAAACLDGDPSLANIRDFLLGNVRDEALASLRMLSVLPDEWSHGNRSGSDNKNHYADIDLHSGGRKLMDIPLKAKDWEEFYIEQKVPKNRMGALPFRIGQIFVALAEYARNGEFEDFFAAAGILMHYAADASNPAHVSMCSQGNPAWQNKDRYHSLWDNAVIDVQLAAAKVLSRPGELVKPVAGEREAREAAFDVMKRVLGRINVSEDYALGFPDKAGAMKAVREYLKSADGMKDIAECAADSAVLWIRLIRSALDGANLAASRFSRSVNHDDVYNDKDFLKSLALSDYS